MKNLRKILLFSLGLFMVGQVALAAATFTPEQQKIYQDLMQGQEQILARDFQSALLTFKRLQVEYPESPAGYFGEMSLYEVQMLEQEDFHLEKVYLETAAAGKKAIDAVMQRYTLNPWDLMYAGSLLGLEGFLHARKGEWLSAYLLGTESRQIFQRILKLDPNFVDAEFGIGMYVYWRSVFANRLKWIPFIPDQRRDGINMVEKVATQGKIAKDLAMLNLAMIELEEKHYAAAERILSTYAQRFPKNVLFRMMLGRSLLAQKKYEAAQQVFVQALANEEHLPKAHYFLAVTLILTEKTENFSMAETELNTFFANKPAKDWQAYAWYWRGRLYELYGEKLRAKNAYDQAILLEPSLKDAKFRLHGLGGGLEE